MKRLWPLIALLAGCQSEPVWQGWVYPDADDEALSISLTGFDTFEQWQEAAINQLRRLPNPRKAWRHSDVRRWMSKREAA